MGSILLITKQGRVILIVGKQTEAPRISKDSANLSPNSAASDGLEVAIKLAMWHF